jgi:hypothetical protein
VEGILLGQLTILREKALFNSGRGRSPERQADSCSSSSAAKAISSCFWFVLSLVPFYRDANAAGIWGKGVDRQSKKRAILSQAHGNLIFILLPAV